MKFYRQRKKKLTGGGGGGAKKTSAREKTNVTNEASFQKRWGGRAQETA